MHNIHHGKNKNFEIEDLKKLQLIAIDLIHDFIGKIEGRVTKYSILNEIDEAILNA